MAQVGSKAKLAAVAELFEPQQWDSMLQYDKLQAANIYHNYKTMLSFGLGGKPPDFVLACERRKQQRNDMGKRKAHESPGDLGPVPPPPKVAKTSANRTQHAGIRSLSGQSVLQWQRDLVQQLQSALGAMQVCKQAPTNQQLTHSLNNHNHSTVIGFDVMKDCLIEQAKTVLSESKTGCLPLGAEAQWQLVHDWLCMHKYRGTRKHTHMPPLTSTTVKPINNAHKVPFPRDSTRFKAVGQRSAREKPVKGPAKAKVKATPLAPVKLGDFSPPGPSVPAPCLPPARRSARDKPQVNYAQLELLCDRAAGVTSTNKLNTRKCLQHYFYCAVCSEWMLVSCVDHPYIFVKDTGGTVWKTFAEGDKSGYSWEIDNAKTGKTFWLDGGDEKVGNWMRFVNHANEANLEAMQWRSCIWYVAKKTIHTGMELTVSYGADYGKQLKPAEPTAKTKKTTLDPVKLDAIVNAGAVLACSQCEKRYTDASLLEQHVKTKHTLSDHQCHICNKYFPSEGNMNKHMSTVHEGDKRHQCPTCGKAFGQLGNLVAHIKSMHEGHKFACNECGKQFNQKSHLKSHSLTHSGARPYVCDMCGKGFTQPGSLTKHRKTVHLHIKAHQCPLCEKRFGDGSNMKTHMRRVHSNE